MGKLHISNQDIELKTDSGKIINPRTVADTLNSFYIDCTEYLLLQNKSYINGQTSETKIKYNSNTMFVYPVTEDELNQPSNRRRIKSGSK